MSSTLRDEWATVDLSWSMYQLNDNDEMTSWLSENAGAWPTNWTVEYAPDVAKFRYSFSDPKVATLFILRWS